jgi:phage gp29-like protein
VADIFNEQLIPSIIRLNYGDEDELPVCRFLQDNEGTFQDAQRDQILVNMGTPIPVSHIRKKYSIPEPEGDEEILAPPVRTPEPTTAAGQPIPLTEKASQGQPITEQQRQRSAAQQAEEPQSAAKETPVARGETPTQKQLAAGLERISKIKDDELFAREFRRLTSALAIMAGKL